MKQEFFVLLSCLAIASCADASATRSEVPDTTLENAMQISFRVENDAGTETQSFQPGGTVHFVFEVRNPDDTSRSLAFTFPPHRVEVFAMAGDAPMWQAWEGRMFPQVMRQQSVAAGESVTFSIEWDTADLRAGRYRVEPSFHGFVQPGDERFGELPDVVIDVQH